MTPTKEVRKQTYMRDRNRCAACGALSPLTFQHRNNAIRATRPTYPEGLTLCGLCNALCEASMQTKAFCYGWKVRSWVEEPGRVPVFYQPENTWWLLEPDGTRSPLSRVYGRSLMIGVYGDQWEAWRDEIRGRQPDPYEWNGRP